MGAPGHIPQTTSSKVSVVSNEEQQPSSLNHSFENASSSLLPSETSANVQSEKSIQQDRPSATAELPEPDLVTHDIHMVNLVDWVTRYRHPDRFLARSREALQHAVVTLGFGEPLVPHDMVRVRWKDVSAHDTVHYNPLTRSGTR